MSDARGAIEALLDQRDAGSTICPSEAARAIAPGDAWREAMPAVHDAVDRLVREKAVRLSWKGETMAQRCGPYRIAKLS